MFGYKQWRIAFHYDAWLWPGADRFIDDSGVAISAGPVSLEFYTADQEPYQWEDVRDADLAAGALGCLGLVVLVLLMHGLW